MPDGTKQSGSHALETLRARLRRESGEGLELLEDLEDNPICSLSLDSEVPCVMVSWKRYATSTQLRYIHESLICMLSSNGLHKLLGDDSGLATIHADDQTWIIENWMPRARASGLKAIASKRPDSHFGQIAVESVRSKAPEDLVIRSFERVEDARSWLTHVEI